MFIDTVTYNPQEMALVIKCETSGEELAKIRNVIGDERFLLHCKHIDIDAFTSLLRGRKEDLMKRAIFNPPATIVFWKDGTKTVAKAENEPFDAEKGFAMAVAKKFLTSKDYHRIMASAKDYRESACIDNGGCQIERGD